MGRHLRVVQWTTGKTGAAAVRGIIGHPALDLVGCYAFTAEFATANRTTDHGFMTVEKGRIAGLRGTVAGVSSGRPVIECRFAWKIGRDMTPDWPVTRGYVVDIEGEPNVRLTLESPDGHFDGAVTTAMPCVNAIPAVCAAAPGILNQAELPFVRGSHLTR